MYYLLDDKTERQRLLASGFVLTGANHQLVHFHSMKDLDKKKDNFYNDVRAIFLHDSFFRNRKNYIENRPSDQLKRDLENECAKRSLGFVSFSGDFSSRTIDGNKAYLPIEVFYKNLDDFIQAGSNNLKVLAFGRNFQSEESGLLVHKIKLKLFSLEKNDLVPLELLANFPDLESYFNLITKQQEFRTCVEQARDKKLTKFQILQKLRDC